MNDKARADAAAGIEVLWDGTFDRPWGPYIGVEREDEVHERMKPLRKARDLEPTEVVQLLADVKVMSQRDVAMRLHVHPDTVDFIVNAAASGLLVQG